MMNGLMNNEDSTLDLPENILKSFNPKRDHPVPTKDYFRTV
jgi:hypothetical protein